MLLRMSVTTYTWEVKVDLKAVTFVYRLPEGVNFIHSETKESSLS